MKTIGLIGGMSCESSAEYYRLINESIRERLGGLNSAKVIMNSLNFQDIADLQHSGDWDRLQEIINEAGLSLERAGADCILICTNLMHKCAPGLELAVQIPLIHIADACGEVIKSKNINKILLLGTIYTMEGDFYIERLKEKFDIDAIIPNLTDRQVINSIIYEELCKGTIKDSSKQEYLRVVNSAEENGAKAALLACTEIPLLIKNGEANIPLFETTKIHAEKAVDFALASTLQKT
jgi:aspartate racemase